MTKEIDNQTLYEIFRACRLCGAGGGYKMPIIQTVDGFDCPDVELRQKIKECVQIEVNTSIKTSISVINSYKKGAVTKIR